MTIPLALHQPPRNRPRSHRGTLLLLTLWLVAACEPRRGAPASTASNASTTTDEGAAEPGPAATPEPAQSGTSKATATTDTQLNAPSHTELVDFDDCVLFRRTAALEQYRCKPRGLALVRDPATSGLESSLQFVRALERIYPPDQWEASSPTSLNPEHTDAALLQSLIRARKGAAELVAVGGALETGALAVCMLPAKLPNARTACRRSVETMQRGRLPSGEATALP